MERDIPELHVLKTATDRKELQKSEIFKHAFVIRNMFSHQECQHYINEIENAESWKKFEWNREQPYRFCDRVTTMNPELAELCWSRVKPYFDFIFEQKEEMPIKIGYTPKGVWKPLSLNEKFRIVRYTKNGYFGPHTDGDNVVDMKHRSLFTFMIYLNGSELFKGGSTDFIDGDLWLKSQEVKILHELKPEEGMCICFYHDIWHQGSLLEDGKKYIMRSDVMFEKIDDYITTDKERLAREYLQLSEDIERCRPHMTDDVVKYAKMAYKLVPELQYSPHKNKD